MRAFLNQLSFLPWVFLPFLLGGLAILHWGEYSSSVLLMREALLAFGYAASLGDIREKRVPNKLVALMALCWGIILVPLLFMRKQEAVPLLISGCIGSALAGILFFIVYLLSRKGLGGGDVKFMMAAGLYLGFSGVLPVMLAGSILAGITGLVLIFARKIGRKETIPLIPFLYVGIVLTVFFR